MAVGIADGIFKMFNIFLLFTEKESTLFNDSSFEFVDHLQINKFIYLMTSRLGVM